VPRAPRHHHTLRAATDIPGAVPVPLRTDSENALRMAARRPAVTTIVERLFEHEQDTPIRFDWRR
jgi:hypothetical protein